MKAVFGKLDGDEIFLHEGLNIIYAPNESGKSTWCAFIKAMLYGIDSSRREKAGEKPDKLRYAPWSGKPMYGELDISDGDRNISLIRKTKKESSPMRELTACYTGTASRAESYCSPDVGQKLTGIPKAVFESSVYIGQSRMAVENSAELEKRIASIVSSGDERCSYSEAAETLRAWQRKRKYNRSGAIPETEEKISQLKDRLSGLEINAQRRRELMQQLALAEKEQERLDSERDAEYAEKRNGLIAAAEKSRELLAQAEEEFSNRRVVEETQHTELEKAEKKLAKRSKIAILLCVLPALLCAAAAALLFTYGKKSGFFAAAAALVLLAAAFVLTKRSQTPAKEQEKWQHADIELEKSLRQLEKLKDDCRKAELALFNGVSGGPAADEAAAGRRRLEKIRRELDQLDGRQSAGGDPLVIGTELKNAEDKLKELEQDSKAIALALSVLADADAEMQARFAPELSRCASEYMSRLTDGRYERLVFDRGLIATTRLSGEPESRDLGFASVGASDQLYFALRLALCRLALPEGKSCPLILDDALVNFDDERMGAALELLKEISAQRQVILFTCHKREEMYLHRMMGQD